ncbi:TATA box-binding protein-associated factor RNA polymerase I subunit B isoform X1 [Ictalurus furcatus]|uniref:TATA box-binding protein-associated factor RNA polymerase I subunit B isoform X1 n=1 Tax=Ictalurus furcatus TaxID=66913 RepID=UPI0023507767|nr:TATA box-binding protein-associated factor RNA polymerase I subunit B isoform X1 [Ictalurus furcatus]
MDEEITDGYSEPCGQCGSVCWGVTNGGQFFCKNCHNVIERMKEVEDMSRFTVNSRISSLSSSKRKREVKGRAREWMICEGFQLILKLQAEALVDLGVCPQLKADVLWIFWKRYMQKTRQAYTRNPVNILRGSVDQTSDTEVESSVAFSDASCYSETGSMMGASSVSGYSSDGRSSVCSGSVDAECYFGQKDRKNLMTMPRTLAFCYLALLWVREAITLADLLRLVSKGHIPYVNAHALFPEDMKFFGKDAMIFRVESIPSYSNVHRDAVSLAALIELPAFPPVTPDCLLHPALLSLRYLMDANLPDKLHALVCEVIQKTSMGTDSFLTFDPTERKPRLPCYDLQAAALIVVCMKLLFRLDDNVEWKLAKKSDEKINEMDHGKSKTTKRGGKMFSLRKWFMIVQPALERARKKEQQATAMQQWKSEKPIIPSLKHKTVVLKRRRVVEQLQSSFKALSGSAPEQQASTPSTFTFLWGDEDGADGPSLRHRCLDYLMMNKKRFWHFVNRKYWHTDLRRCYKRQCGDHFGELEPTLPRMYVWLLGLFSFTLGVEDAKLHGAVVQVEQRLLRKTGHNETPENLDE